MKVLLDTNVWIDFLRNAGQREAFEASLGRPHFYMSSVVAMELFAGCRTSRQQSSLQGFLKPFQKSNRIVVPDERCFHEAGRILAKLGVQGVPIVQVRRMTNDILIAVSGTRAGMTIVTNNSRDFRQIERHTPLRWRLPS